MEYILIFTNRERLAELQSHKLSWNPREEPIKTISTASENLFVILFDKLPDLSKVLDLFNKPNDKVYILYHNGTDHQIIQKLEDYLLKKGITHEKPMESHHNNTHIYGKLILIDVNKDNPEKLENIFNELKLIISGDPVLELKLELLHYCLDKKYFINKNQQKKLLELTEEEEKSRIISAIDAYNAHEKKELDGLRNLRDVLLEK